MRLEFSEGRNATKSPKTPSGAGDPKPAAQRGAIAQLGERLNGIQEVGG